MPGAPFPTVLVSAAFLCIFTPYPSRPPSPPLEAGNRACRADVDKLRPDWSITRELCDFIFHCFWLRSYRSSNPQVPALDFLYFRSFLPTRQPFSLSPEARTRSQQ